MSAAISPGAAPDLRETSTFDGTPCVELMRAQRTFALERPARPDAAGAVTALGETSDALIEELLGWTAQNLKGMALK